jgi:hypothetical protein
LAGTGVGHGPLERAEREGARDPLARGQGGARCHRNRAPAP